MRTRNRVMTLYHVGLIDLPDNSGTGLERQKSGMTVRPYIGDGDLAAFK